MFKRMLTRSPIGLATSQSTTASYAIRVMASVSRGSGPRWREPGSNASAHLESEPTAAGGARPAMFFAGLGLRLEAPPVQLVFRRRRPWTRAGHLPLQTVSLAVTFSG